MDESMDDLIAERQRLLHQRAEIDAALRAVNAEIGQHDAAVLAGMVRQARRRASYAPYPGWQAGDEVQVRITGPLGVAWVTVSTVEGEGDAREVSARLGEEPGRWRVVRRSEVVHG